MISRVDITYTLFFNTQIFDYEKVKLPYSLFLILTLFCLVGCEQNDFVQPQEVAPPTETNYQIESRSGVTLSSNGVSSPRFVFNSEASFEDFMHDLETFDIDSFLNNLLPHNYQAFYNRTGIRLDSFGEPVLEAVLNAYGVIEIDGYLIRLNPQWDKFYVMSSATSPAEQRAFERAASDVDICDLPTPTAILPIDANFFAIRAANNGEIPDIFGSSSDDDSGCDPQPIAGNCCEGRDSDDDDGRSCKGSSGGGTGSIKVLYKRFGIWERMKVKFKHKSFPTGYTISFNSSWTVQCNGANQARQGSSSGNGEEAEISLYSSTKCLGDYFLSASASFQDPCGGSIFIGPVAISG
jgi:hypothetical protein